MNPSIDHRFRAAQRRMLLATMFCYLFFYTGRQTFGFAIPGIEDELGISKSTLGWASAAMLWSYAIDVMATLQGSVIESKILDRESGDWFSEHGALRAANLGACSLFGRRLGELGNKMDEFSTTDRNGTWSGRQRLAFR